MQRGRAQVVVVKAASLRRLPTCRFEPLFAPRGIIGGRAGVARCSGAAARPRQFSSLPWAGVLGHEAGTGSLATAIQDPTIDGPESAEPSMLKCRWWTEGGSNSRPLHCERSALPAELSALTTRLYRPASGKRSVGMFAAGGRTFSPTVSPEPTAARPRRSATACQDGDASGASTRIRAAPR